MFGFDAMPGYQASADGQGQAVSAGSLNMNTIANQQLSVGAGSGLTPVTFLIGAIGLLVIMKFLGESKSTKIDPAHLHIGPYNIIAVGVTSILSIVLLKILFNSIQIPGITDLVNAA